MEAAPLRDRPALQALQELMPDAVASYPLSQGTQVAEDTAPMTLLLVPAMHSVQPEAPAAEDHEPGEH
jgi:hypothetical protein